MQFWQLFFQLDWHVCQTQITIKGLNALKVFFKHFYRA